MDLDFALRFLLRRKFDRPGQPGASWSSRVTGQKLAPVSVGSRGRRPRPMATDSGSDIDLDDFHDAVGSHPPSPSHAASAAADRPTSRPRR